mmetsp:Transcript_16326/g.29084  ORF Transcript_16326/g.29084 Transcript_16326/m.29084 type:complete len:156 (-) Transcript_16326:96-563(-)
MGKPSGKKQAAKGKVAPGAVLSSGLIPTPARGDSVAWPAGTIYLTDNVFAKEVPKEVWQKYLPPGQHPKTDPRSASLPKPPKKNKKVSICKIVDPDHPAHGQHGLFANVALQPKAHILDYRGYCTLHGQESKTSDCGCCSTTCDRHALLLVVLFI